MRIIKQSPSNFFFDYVKSLNVLPELFIDVGIGHPNSEAWECRKRYPNCKIFGFEPNPSRYELIEYEFPGQILRTAVGNYNGILNGWMGIPEYPESNSDFKFKVKNKEKDNYQEVSITCVKLDTFVPKNAKNIILWADIEGSELTMLKGTKDLLKSKRILALSLEILNDPEWYNKNEIDTLLNNFGYFNKIISQNDFVYGLER